MPTDENQESGPKGPLYRVKNGPFILQDAPPRRQVTSKDFAAIQISQAKMIRSPKWTFNIN